MSEVVLKQPDQRMTGRCGSCSWWEPWDHLGSPSFPFRQCRLLTLGNERVHSKGSVYTSPMFGCIEWSRRSDGE